jgi:hypothetical protein
MREREDFLTPYKIGAISGAVIARFFESSDRAQCLNRTQFIFHRFIALDIRSVSVLEIEIQGLTFCGREHQS